MRFLVRVYKDEIYRHEYEVDAPTEEIAKRIVQGDDCFPVRKVFLDEQTVNIEVDKLN